MTGDNEPGSARGADLHQRPDQNGRDKVQPDLRHRRRIERGEAWWQGTGEKEAPEPAARNGDDPGREG